MLLLGACIAMTLHASTIVRPIAPDEHDFDGAVTVVDTAEQDGIAYATVRIPYLDMRAQPKAGLGRVFVSTSTPPGSPLPAFVHVHYEKDLAGARGLCERGWAVFTAHYDAEAGAPLDISIGDSVNLARALIQWVRRLPYIDRTRLHIDGGSQGGFMALAMAAEMFPVTACTPDVPVVNWAYNLNYFETNKRVSGYPEDWTESPLPVLCAVSELADVAMKSSPVPSAYGIFGADLSNPSYYYVSPISHVDRVACPTLISVNTGDMLVPHEQITDRLPTNTPDDFPAEYTRDFQTITLIPEARKTLEEAVGAEHIHVEVVHAPEGLHELKAEHVFGKEPEPAGPPATDRPWSKDKQWSLVIHDEGPPRPWSPHSRYKWSESPNSFIEYYRDAAPAPSILNAAKLRRLIDRYTQTPEQGLKLADGAVVNRFNFETIEKVDVVRGLLDYASLGSEHRNRLAGLYGEMTSKPFGDDLSIDRLTTLQAELVSRMTNDVHGEN